MELQQLRYYLTALDEGSFSGAAQKHRVTQQAVSKSVGRLERELGSPLFVREGHSIKPTAVGRLLAEHAQVMDSESRQFQRRLDELLGIQPAALQIGAGPTAARGLVAEAVRRMSEDSPTLHVSVTGGTTRSMTPQLKRGELDAFVSVLVQRKPDPQLLCEVIYNEPTVLVARAEHPLARRRRVTLADTLQFPWLGGAGMDHWGDLVRSSFVAAGLKPPQPKVKTDSLPFAYGLIANTDHLAVMPSALVQLDVDAGHLTSIKTPVDWSRPVALFYRNGGGQPAAVSTFLKTLRSIARRLDLHTRKAP